MTKQAAQAPEIVTVGTVALDTIHTPTSSAERVLGGSAMYFALAARFLARTGIVSAIGSDFPPGHIDDLSRRGIALEGLQKLDRPSFFWEGRYFEGLSRRETLKVNVEIFERFRPEVPSGWRKASCLFLANGSPAHQLAVLEQVPAARFVMSDSMNLWIETDRDRTTEVFRRSHGVFLNDEEARQYAGTDSLLTAAQRIAELGPRIVVLKKGEHGCLALVDGELRLLPAFPLHAASDPTGAGDSFAGGVMGYLAVNGDATPDALHEALLWGTALGSFCVETVGPERLLELSRGEVEERVGRLRRMVSGR